MRIPDRLTPLVEIGVIQEVVRPLMSGKEAAVYLVECDGELRVAKVYKESIDRSFQNRADYTEGRKVRNSRDQRAMAKRSKFGREQIESAWRTAEVDAIYKLRAAGVRVPEPFAFEEGVLVMELIRGADGGPAPRLVDMDLTVDEAMQLMDMLLRETVKMLCAGVVHGDLSDFNVLIEHDGPVIIDFPQWVDPAHNRNARKLLIRDVENLTLFLSRAAPELAQYRFGPEMWDLYEAGQLRPETPLTGRWRPKQRVADVSGVLGEIQAAEREGRPKRVGGRLAVSSFFEGLEWPDADASKKGPAARARRAATEPPPPPEPPPRPAPPQRQGPPPQQQRQGPPGQRPPQQQQRPPQPQRQGPPGPRPPQQQQQRPPQPPPQQQRPPQGSLPPAADQPPSAAARRRRRRRRSGSREGGGGGGGDE